MNLAPLQSNCVGCGARFTYEPIVSRLVTIHPKHCPNCAFQFNCIRCGHFNNVVSRVRNCPIPVRCEYCESIYSVEVAVTPGGGQ